MGQGVEGTFCLWGDSQVWEFCYCWKLDKAPFIAAVQSVPIWTKKKAHDLILSIWHMTCDIHSQSKHTFCRPAKSSYLLSPYSASNQTFSTWRKETRVLLDQYPDGSPAEAQQQLPSKTNILAQLGGWLVAGATWWANVFNFTHVMSIMLMTQMKE